MVQPDIVGVHALGNNGLSRPWKEKLLRDIIACIIHDMRRHDIHLHRSGRIPNHADNLLCNRLRRDIGSGCFLHHVEEEKSLFKT